MMSKKWVAFFVFTGIFTFAVLVWGAAKRQGWFEPTNEYVTQFSTGDGIYPGTMVTITGLRAGSVTGVHLDESNQVVVRMKIHRKFAPFIRDDSVAELGRYFVIGERFISIRAGSRHAKLLAEGARIEGKVTLELTDIVSGQVLGKYLEMFQKLMDQLAVVINGDNPNDKNLVEMYRQLYAALKSVEKMGNVVGDKSTAHLLQELSRSASELSQMVAGLNQTVPQVGGLATNLNDVLPKLTQTLGETTFTLQALQRSFILRGAAKDLQKEIAERGQKEPVQGEQGASGASVPERHPAGQQ